ncbi:hypothetical protein TNIN_34451, partial [Trichonephila inaurata madagascariensis]
MIVRSATNKPMTSAQNIANELLSSCNVSVSSQTVRNVLHSAGLKARTPRKKPYISESIYYFSKEIFYSDIVENMDDVSLKDDTDARGTLGWFKPQDSSGVILGSLDSEDYFMNYPKRGKCLIFNHK